MVSVLAKDIKISPHYIYSVIKCLNAVHHSTTANYVVKTLYCHWAIFIRTSVYLRLLKTSPFGDQPAWHYQLRLRPQHLAQLYVFTKNRSTCSDENRCWHSLIKASTFFACLPFGLLCAPAMMSMP